MNASLKIKQFIVPKVRVSIELENAKHESNKSHKKWSKWQWTLHPETFFFM
jgi:hypothetical protein